MADHLLLDLHAELVNVFLFLLAIWKSGSMTGLILVPLALIGNELWKRKINTGVRRGH